MMSFFGRSSGDEAATVLSWAYDQLVGGGGEGIGKIGADGGALGDNSVAMLDRRHLTHRVDLQVLGRELLRVGADVDLVHVVRQAAFLQHD